ncbi:MAG: hypothetical protein AB1750_09995 [Chloroflexota bacterium]
MRSPILRYVGLLALALLTSGRASAQTATGPVISAPVSGQVLRGVVEIRGTTAVDGFFSAELSFAYASDSTQTWFLISSLDLPISDGLLASWDTNLVTDGDYDLRLRVTLADGTILEALVTNLRIRNLVPTETATLPPTLTPVPFDTLEPTYPPTFTPVPTVTRRPSPTPLPPNPAAVTQPEIASSLARGLIAAFIAFLVIGLFLRLRR